MKYLYPVDLLHEDGDIVITFPDFPEAVSQADSDDEVPANAADCLEEAVAGRIDDKEEIPSPSPLNGRPGVAVTGRLAAKAALYGALKEAGLRPADLARRLGHSDHIQVRRLLDPRHRSSSDALEAALAALGKRLVVEVKDAA